MPIALVVGKGVVVVAVFVKYVCMGWDVVLMMPVFIGLRYGMYDKSASRWIFSIFARRPMMEPRLLHTKHKIKWNQWQDLWSDLGEKHYSEYLEIVHIFHMIQLIQGDMIINMDESSCRKDSPEQSLIPFNGPAQKMLIILITFGPMHSTRSWQRATTLNIRY